MPVTPLPPGYQTPLSAEGLQAAVPARRSLLALLFLVIWLGGWCFGEVQAIEQLRQPSDKPPTAVLLLWLAGWTVGALGIMLGQFPGRERLTVDAMALAHRIEIFGLGLTRRYAGAEIKAPRASPAGSLAQYQAWLPALMGPTRDALAFHCGARTIRLAPGWTRPRPVNWRSNWPPACPRPHALAEGRITSACGRDRETRPDPEGASTPWASSAASTPYPPSSWRGCAPIRP